MRVTRIVLILLLGILLVSGVACGPMAPPTPTPTPTPTATPTPTPTPTPTKQVNSCVDANTALYVYLDSLAQSTSGAIALSYYWAARYTSYCGAYDEDGYPLEEAELEELYYFVIEERVHLIVEGEPLWEILPESTGNNAECQWCVFPEDGSVIPCNANAARVKAELMR
jgi:hypothetical protein